MIETEKFGRTFREERFMHAIQADAELKLDHDNYRRLVKNNPMLLVESEFQEAQRVAAWGIFVLYCEILDYGEPEEIAQAKQIVTIFEKPLDKTPTGGV